MEGLKMFIQHNMKAKGTIILGLTHMLPIPIILVRRPFLCNPNLVLISGTETKVQLWYWNTAPPSRKGGNSTRCISCKRVALYINLMQAPHWSRNLFFFSIYTFLIHVMSFEMWFQLWFRYHSKVSANLGQVSGPKPKQWLWLYVHYFASV